MVRVGILPLRRGASPAYPYPAAEIQRDTQGHQSAGGSYATVIGNIANGRSQADPRQYATVTRTGRHTVRSDAAGNLWLMVGTDSGFAGRTRLFYQSVEVKFTPA